MRDEYGDAWRQVGGFLGLCFRAGQMILGAEGCLKAVRAKNLRLVLVDEAASENAQKRFRDACTTHGIPLFPLPAGLLQSAVGKAGRMTAGISPGGMADRLDALLRQAAQAGS